MCGICGILANGPIDPATLRAMQSSIDHRGPDGAGEFMADGIGLAHRRLSVIDLENGDQPIYNEDNSICIVFNGEIYNYRELRQELVGRGHQFRTESDTEVIVHLYEDDGVACLRRLNGMFAIALWDLRKKQLFIARDRVGVKPLVYARGGDNLLFSSEINSIVASELVDLEIDQQALRSYMALGYVPAPLTIYKNISKLEPAHYILFDLQGNQVDGGRYWQPMGDRDRFTSYPQAVEELRNIITDAISRRMISDVPLGSLLSGGLDSGLITGVMSQISMSPVKTFSIGFPGQEIIDESSYALRTAQHFSTDHTSFDLTPHDLIDSIPEILGRLGEPFSGGGSMIPTYLVSKLAREQVTVALSGDGADELFAGYEKYLGIYYQRYYRLLPKFVRHGVVEPLFRLFPVSRESKMAELTRKAQRFLNTAQNPREQHLQLMQLDAAEDMCAMIGLSNVQTHDVTTRIAHIYGKPERVSGKNDVINASLYTDFTFGLPNDMLTKVDLASMYNSLEVRSPFLDYRVAEIAFAMPGFYKMRGRNRKRVLRDAFADLLPSFVMSRPKKGFDIPIGSWFKNELRELFWDTLSTAGGPVSIDRDRVESLYRRHVANEIDAGRLLWTIFVMKYWSNKRKD